MLGELGTKQKVLDQEHQKRIDEQNNYQMETMTGTWTIEPRASQVNLKKIRSFKHALRTKDNK